MSYSAKSHQTTFVRQLIYLTVIQWTPVALGGVCWEVFDSSNSLCRKAFNMNTTYEECCSTRGLATASWSPHTKSSDIFYFNFMAGGGDQCQRCHKTCSTVHCEPDKMCRMQSGFPTCVCKRHCPEDMKAKGRLCGSDERMYRNICALRKMNCITRRNVEVEYFGKCRNSCKHVRCEGGQHCLEDQNGFPHCVVCNEKCNRPEVEYSPICGVNGVTYRNTCHLKAAICREGRSIRIAHEGPCNVNATCFNFQCPRGQQCLVNLENGQPVCWTCDNFCLVSVKTPVCGTDGHTYSDYCQMTMVACSKGVFITTKRSGKCKADKKNHPIGEFEENKETLLLDETNETGSHKKGRSKEKHTRAKKRRRREHKREKKKRRQQKKNKHTKLQSKGLKNKQFYVKGGSNRRRASDRNAS